MHRKPPRWSRDCLPRSSSPTQPMTPIICAKTLPPKKRSPSSPTTRHAHSNIHSTSISMPSAISWNAVSQNSSSSVASLPASKKPPEITKPSSLSLLSSYGCDKCPHRLGDRAARPALPSFFARGRERQDDEYFRAPRRTTAVLFRGSCPVELSLRAADPRRGAADRPGPLHPAERVA